MNINTNQAGAASLKRNAAEKTNLYIKNAYVNDYVRQRSQQKKTYHKYSSGAEGEEECAASLRELMYEKRKKDKNDDFYSRFTQNSIDYAESIRASRAKNQKTKAKVQKLRYSFKSISSQIMKSKTSITARQVAGKAKREVVRLRQKKMSAQYDPDEVRIALNHAMRIERVAKKKVKHLLEEEMVKVTGGPCAGELEEKLNERSEDEKAEEAVAAMENGMSGEDAAAMQQRRAMSSQEQAQYIQEQMQAMQDMMQAQMEQMRYAMEMAQEKMQASMEDMMSEFMDEMEESMEKLMEESGLSELTEEIIGGFDMEMDPADYHMMKLKHRAKELKEIAEADAEYLKAVFNRLERMKDSVMREFSGSSDNNAASVASVPAGAAPVVAANTESAAEIVHESADIGGSKPVGTFSSVGISVSSPAPVVGGSVDVSV